MKKLLHLYKQNRKILSFKDCCKINFQKSSIISIFNKKWKKEIFLRPRSSDILCFNQICVYNSYNFFVKLKPKTIVDAGANIGLFALDIHFKYPEAKIVCIEPDFKNYQILNKNVEKIRNIETHNTFLSATKKKYRVVHKEGNEWSSFIVPSKKKEAKIGLKISELVRKLKKIDILKIDIEGSEKEVFEQISIQDLKKIQVIIIEFHDRLKNFCARAFYKKICNLYFLQENVGESTVITFCKK